jgi:Bacterial Ig-like domain
MPSRSGPWAVVRSDRRLTEERESHKAKGDAPIERIRSQDWARRRHRRVGVRSSAAAAVVALALLTPLAARAVPLPPTISNGPATSTNEKSASFTFTHGVATVAFSCSLDGGPAETCTSPKVYPGPLPDGPHKFEVRASDATGASEPAIRNWTVDTVEPDTSISSGPGPVSNSASATFIFSSTEAASTFSCSLDSLTFETCSSPLTYNGLADGPHTFRVRATDAAGNTDASPDSRTWTIDATAPPQPTITSGPATPTSQRIARFAFLGGEVGAAFFCRLDDAEFEACSSPESYTSLRDGTHTFEVRARDAAGNNSVASPYSWTVDTIAPDTAITSAPPRVSNGLSATFSFRSTEELSTFLCSRDGAAYAACVPPRTYRGLPKGVHTFRVRATDAARNTDSTPAAAVWTVRTRGPRRIDQTPPGNVKKVARMVRYRLLKLRWRPPADADFDHVVVTVGRNPERQPRTPVYKGAGTSYTNSKFRNGSYHRYAITSYDRAGNASRKVAVVVPASVLLPSPRVGTRLQRPPLLDWASVPKATYYNVQLWVGSKKVLTVWPSRSSFKLTRAWSYRRAINRLNRGTYRWYVWPGFGRRSQARFGQLLGRSSFVITSP